MKTLPDVITLIEQVKEQIRLNIRSRRERKDILLFLDNLAVFAKRVLNIPLTKSDFRLPEHQLFSGMVAVPSQVMCQNIARRLRVVLRYRITASDKLKRDLLYGLYPWPGKPLTREDITLLSILYKEPKASPPVLAKRMGVSSPTMRKHLEKLVEKAGLRFANFLDVHRFKLRHISVIFETRGVKASQRLEYVLRDEMNTYLRSSIIDLTSQRGWATFQIPDQARPLQLFHRQLSTLEEAFFKRMQVHYITGNFFSVGFDSFDFETGTWHIEGDFATLGLVNFARENWGVLPKPQGLHYTKMQPFDQLDYYIANFLVGEGRPSTAKLLERLSSVGIHAPRTTVATRKSQLIRDKTIVPYILFGTPHLSMFMSFAIRCDPSITELLLLSAAQMPYSFVYPSEIGCGVHLNIPGQNLGVIIQLFSMLRVEKGVQEVLQIQQYKNLGSKNPDIGQKWNGSYWNWQEEEFLLPALGLK